MRLLSSLLDTSIRVGTLEVIEAGGGRRRFGAGRPEVTIRLHDRATAWRLFASPSLGLGEAYTDGRLTVERGTLRDLLDLCGGNYRTLMHHTLPLAGLALRWLARRTYQLNRATRSRRNVAHHYDLSDELYALFLDRDRQYSCAYFLSPTDTLEQAQDNKRRHIAAKLLLRPGLKVLDIGCGWGGLLLDLAEGHGVSGTGVTLSTHQLEIATRHARERGLSDRVRFVLADYRQIEGRFDRVVSVGMFEHVGIGFYRTFFERVRELLGDGGVALVHSIGSALGPHVTDPWIEKYIFPGGYIPALSEVLPAAEKGRLYATDVEIMYSHYAETLRCWHERFQANRKRIEALYDARFCRMWEYYLLASEMSFRHRWNMVFQLQLARDPAAVPRARDYITDAGREPAKKPRLALAPDRAAS